ncbi:hypothetical protein ACFL0Z_00960, partial [Patescibacteria group bacterium]
MTRRNTLIIAVIVIAVAVAGVFSYAYWDQIRTMVGVVEQQYNTGWIELRNGSAANGDIYQIAQNPNSGPGENYGPPAPNPPFSPNIQSRWDCTGCTENPGPIWLNLGEDAPAGTFNVETFLNYDSGTSEVQAEPLLIETIDTRGTVVDSVTIRDDESGQCSEDNTGWLQVTTDCSSGGGTPLSLEFAAGGGIRFTATGGSISIGGVRVYGVISGPDVSVNIPKTANPKVIESTGTMNFTFSIQNNGTDEATHVILYESLVDNNLDGQIDMETSTLGGASLISLMGGQVQEYCPDPTPEGSYCFLDLGGTPGVPDTIIGYVATLGPGSTDVNLVLKPKITLGGGGQQATGFEENIYTNAVGITAAEINPGNPTYPPTTEEDLVEGLDGDGVNDWNWVNQTAQVTVGGVAPPGEASALLTKSHAEVGAGGTIDPGDT